MKILSKAQIYEGDKLTVTRQEITSTDLMERAGSEIFNWIHLRMQGAQVPIHVFCGIGNNGGDGLVLARHLILAGYHVNTFVVNYSDKRSKDFLINYDRIKHVTKHWPKLLTDDDDFPIIGKDDIIVDAIFGIGLNKPVANWVKTLFKHLRASGAFTLSIDIPSGLHTDSVPANPDDVVWASHTLSFVSPKLIFFLPQTAKYTQQWDALDIGFDSEFLYNAKTSAELIGKQEVLYSYMPRDKFSHKGHFGHSLIIGGSYGKVGALTLAARAALSAGAGLVTAYTPKCGYLPLQAALPEAMVITDNTENIISNIKFEVKPTVIGVGVGLGTHTETTQAFKAFLKENTSPLVIDADAINILSKNNSMLNQLPKNTVLTPHPKELERLIGAWANDFDKLEKAKAFATKYECILVVKGAHTITVTQDRYYINTTGNPGLATAGSGDVLTGIITGLISQGYDPLVAAVFGVYLHGKSADIAVKDWGYESLLASHVIDYLGEAYKDLFINPDTVQEQEESDKNA